MTEKPLTRQQRLANMARILGERVGETLVLYGGSGRVQLCKQWPDSGITHLSPLMPIGQMETLLETAIQLAMTQERNKK